MRSIIYVVPFLCLVLMSCASRDAGWDKKTESVTLSAAESAAITKEAMSAWKGRLSQDSLKLALENFSKLHAADPSNLENLIYLTRGYYFLADSHMDDIEEKKKTYEKAASFGEKAMATNGAFKKSVSSGKTVEESLGTLTSKEVPAIYWTAASLGKWAKASGIAAALKYKTRIKAMIERVEKLQPDYFFAAPSRYWGGFFAVAPSFAGGDLNKSKQQFEKSLKLAPEYQGTKVLMADVYFTKKGDKASFQKVLKEVLSSNFDNHPEIGPENALEKKKDEKLLKNMDELF
jgi:hypothetical protein